MFSSWSSGFITAAMSLLLCFGAALGITSGTALGAGESITLNPSQTTGVAVNQTVTVQLVLSSGSAFNAFQGYLEWDKNLLELSSSPSTTLVDANGDVFASAPGFNLANAKAAGFGKRAFFTTAGNITPLTSPVLMTWTFKALANGSAVVQTRQASADNDYTKLSNLAGFTRYPAVGSAVTITIGTTPTNTAPVVNAGIDKSVTLPASVSLTGTATDDGLPTPAALTHLWTKTSGPGTVTFSAASALSTNASFSAAGVYVLRLTTNDGLLSGFDEVTVTANATATNTAPVVNAGIDKTITLPANVSVTGTATDDGLPTPAALTHLWTKQSGPGTVTFSAATSLTTNATFSTAGVYVLRLTTSDGALSGFDDVTVTVNAASTPTVVTSLSYVLKGIAPDAATSVKVIVAGVATTATLSPLTGANRTWTAAITAPVGTTVATVQFVAPDNSVKSRAFNLVR